MANSLHPTIEIIGADANNLQDVEISFPAGKLSMVVGVSGSGKSSLLENTLASEGNLRLKTFLGIQQAHLDDPRSNVFIGSLPATIHVGQKAFRATSRTTVGTASGLLSLLRRIYVQWAIPVSSLTGEQVPKPAVLNYRDWILKNHRGKVVVWTIPISYLATDGVQTVERLRKLGFTECILRSETDSEVKWKEGRLISLNKFKPLRKDIHHLMEIKVGTLTVDTKKQNCAQDLEELLELGFQAGNGRVFIELPAGVVPELDSRRHWVTPGDETLYSPPSIPLLSFNAPSNESSGSCPRCSGLGQSLSLNLDRLITKPDQPMSKGAFVLWTEKNYKYVNIHHETIEGLRGINGFDPDIPWRKLNADAKQLVIEGSGNKLIEDLEPDSRRRLSSPRAFPGFRNAILDRIQRGTSASERLKFLVGEGPCPECNGSRWSRPALALRVGGVSIETLLAMDFGKLLENLDEAAPLSRALPSEAKPYLAQARRLADSFCGVGLAHLSGDRGMLEISEGESRRLRLASVLDGKHSGLCLLLDEPARGLHDEDVNRLGKTLRSLSGTHTFILNDHRKRLARAVDHFVEVGPGAGEKGGKIVYAGLVPKSWWNKETSLNRAKRSIKESSPAIKISGAKINNILGINVSLPLGCLVTIAGVSGSGKSSFIRGILVPALSESLNLEIEEFETCKGRWSSVSGVTQIGGLVALDQRAPAPNRRSTVATFLNLADGIRRHYSKLPIAKSAGLKASDFGFNSGNGRCQHCLGIGEIEETGHWIPCPFCGGSRLGNLVLTVKDNGVNLSNLFDRAISSLCNDTPEILESEMELLLKISSLGVGHLSLGRRLDTLSGGELQRLRIAKELCKKTEKKSVFVLDEPAAGLHQLDVENLLKTLDEIVLNGHTAVVVEHNLEIIEASDWVVEFGPGSGPLGGKLVASGPPEKVRTLNTPTGRMLRTKMRAPPASPTLPKKRSTVATPSPEQAEATLRWLRRLLGDDVNPGKHISKIESSRPAIILKNHGIAGMRLLEFGGLDRELSQLMLECERANNKTFDFNSFVDICRDNNDSEIVYHPLIREMYVWGFRIPKTIIEDRKKQLISIGSVWFKHSDIFGLRASISNLNRIKGNLTDELIETIRAIIQTSGGHVELRDQSRILASFTTRSIDLNRGIVGPLATCGRDFQRGSLRGQCPACRGTGAVYDFNRELILNKKNLPPEDTNFLHPEYLKAIKGVHRNIFLPFFRRMVLEGLWESGVPFSQWNPSRKNELLFGFWARPNHGSFLKSKKHDPKEVSSWLRWDGFFAYANENTSRATPAWASKLKQSETAIACPSCLGIGLRDHASILVDNYCSYSDWLRNGTVGALAEALKMYSPPSPRSVARRDRLLSILGCLVKRGFGKSLIGKAINSNQFHQIAEPISAEFTDMPVVE